MDHATPASIARAKQHQQDERDRVYQQTGIRVTDHGAQLPAVVIGCITPGCNFSSVARTDGRAIRSLACHVVRVHRQEQK